MIEKRLNLNLFYFLNKGKGEGIIVNKLNY